MWKKITSHTLVVGVKGNGFLDINVEGQNEPILNISFTSSGNFAAVCTMLKAGTVFYKNVDGQHKFKSES